MFHCQGFLDKSLWQSVVWVLVVVPFSLFYGEMSNLYLWLSSSVQNSDSSIICKAKSSRHLTNSRHEFVLSLGVYLETPGSCLLLELIRSGSYEL